MKCPPTLAQMITTATSIAYSRQGSQTGLVRINNQSKEDVGFNDCHVMINDDRGIIQMIIIVIIEILKFIKLNFSILKFPKKINFFHFYISTF